MARNQRKIDLKSISFVSSAKSMFVALSSSCTQPLSESGMALIFIVLLAKAYRFVFQIGVNVGIDVERQFVLPVLFRRSKNQAYQLSVWFLKGIFIGSKISI